MTWGGANRPKTSTKLGRPIDREGGEGDIQIKGTALGAKLFAKYSGRWWDVPLGIKGVTKFGTTDSDYLSIDRDSVDIYSNSIKVASFGADVISTKGIIKIETATVDGNLGLLLDNDGEGYNQLVMGGANPEILMGYNSGGASPTADVAGSSKIILNRGAADHMSMLVFASEGSHDFSLGGHDSDFRIAYDGDIRVDGKCGIRIDSSGNIGFRGTAAAAAPNYTISNLSTDRALDCNSTNTSELADVLGQLITDLIAMGILQ